MPKKNTKTNKPASSKDAKASPADKLNDKTQLGNVPSVKTKGGTLRPSALIRTKA